jgi:hypothetical protein
MLGGGEIAGDTAREIEGGEGIFEFPVIAIPLEPARPLCDIAQGGRMPD